MGGALWIRAIKYGEGVDAGWRSEVYCGPALPSVHNLCILHPVLLGSREIRDSEFVVRPTIGFILIVMQEIVF